MKLHIEKVNNYSHHINDWSKAIDTLHPSFRFFLFVEGILKDMDLYRVCQKIQVYNKELREAGMDEITD